DFFQSAVYGKYRAGNAYVAGALAGGAHEADTDRTVAIGGTSDRLTASFTAPTPAGRVESGYRYDYLNSASTPYGALQVQNVWIPNYHERSTNGPRDAQTFSSHDFSVLRTELGSWVETRPAWYAGNLLLRGRAAWVHNFDRDASVVATFATLPGSSFVVTGA